MVDFIGLFDISDKALHSKTKDDHHQTEADDE